MRRDSQATQNLYPCLYAFLAAEVETGTTTQRYLYMAGSFPTVGLSKSQRDICVAEISSLTLEKMHPFVGVTMYGATIADRRPATKNSTHPLTGRQGDRHHASVKIECDFRSPMC